VKISFIGFGNMAKAIARGFQRKTSDQLFASSPSLPAGSTLADGIIAFNDNRKILQDATITILGVKPAKVAEVMQEIGSLLDPETVLLSIVAGVSIQNLASFCRPGQAIVRSMPNLPIEIQQGATPLTTNTFVSDLQKLQVEGLFAQSSLITWCSEDSMNAYTALSGSGPAYVFLFVEALLKGAEALGLSAEEAQQFTVQTMSGSLQFLQTSQQSLQDLRTRVTSPGGTTAAALAIFEQRQFNDIVAEALKAACERAAELDSINNNYNK